MPCRVTFPVPRSDLSAVDDWKTIIFRINLPAEQPAVVKIIETGGQQRDWHPRDTPELTEVILRWALSLS